MLEPKLRGRRRDMLWLQPIDGPRHPRFHVAERAGASASIAEDHHRGVLLGPAFADVRASRFLANSREAEVAHEAARRVIAFADGGLDPYPVGLALLGRNCGRSVHAARDSDWQRSLPPPPSRG